MTKASKTNYSFTEKKRIRKNFGKRRSILEVPFLLAIQVDSYREFLQEKVDAAKRDDKGLHAALKSVFPIVSYSGNAAQRKPLYGDCTLMKSLARAASIVRAHDVHEIIDIGIYNYRCIDQTMMPPNCNMSQHAYAKAIDIAELVTSDATHYSVLKDWVIDSTATCTADTATDKDAFLHKVICELKAAGTWNIVLTPNYNADHRNHFHVDLTKGSDFIKRTHDGAEPLDY